MSALATHDFDFLATLLLKEGGMVVEPSKDYLVATRLDPVARRHGLDGLTALVTRLRGHDPELRADVVDAMTVNETSFFRDPNVWIEMETKLLPDLLERRKNLRRLDVWVAASSSGQEVYTLLMLLCEMLGSERSQWRVQLLATDLSRAMVDRTAQGWYLDHEVRRGLSAARRDRFMHRDGDRWQVNEDLRSSIKTRVANLTDPKLDVRGPFDLILVRNVLIYFTPAMRKEILARQAELLSTHGVLMLGSSEGAGGVPDSLTSQRFGSLVTYHRTGRAPSPTTALPTSSTPNPLRPQHPTTTTQPLGQPKTAEDGLTPLERLRALRKEYQQ